MVLPPCSTRTKRHTKKLLSMIWHQFPCVIGRNTEGVSIMVFGQASGFAERRCLVAKQRGKECMLPKCRIQIALSLHSTLRNLVEMPTDPHHLERDVPLVQVVMAG